MSLLLNVEDLLVVNKVEGERIEFKAGWNPNPTMRSICAFANDFANLGSGYILIGVAEIEEILGINYNTLRKRIDELKKMGSLKREGTRGGFWIVNSKMIE